MYMYIYIYILVCHIYIYIYILYVLLCYTILYPRRRACGGRGARATAGRRAAAGGRQFMLFAINVFI